MLQSLGNPVLTLLWLLGYHSDHGFRAREGFIQG